MKIYGAIEKVEPQDDGTLFVHGIASTEDIDSAGEIIRADAMRRAIPGYSVYPALREMHGLSAAGTTTEIEVGDDNVTRIVGHVVDPVAIKKIKTGTYRGFSIGGKVLKRDPNDRKVITEIDLNEVSLVDRPCNKSCGMSLLKVGGLDVIEDEDADAEGAIDVEDQKNAAAQIETTPQTQEGAPAPSGAQSMTKAAAKPKAADKVEKTVEPTPINASQVSDVMNDGAGNGDATGQGEAVAGKKITPPALPDGGPAVPVAVPNPEEAGQATPAPLGETPVAPVEHVAGQTPVSGTDKRTRKQAAAEGAALTGDSTDGDGQEAAIAKVDPVAAAREAADRALKAATAVMAALNKRDGVVPAPLRAGMELRKGLPATGRLGCLLTELAYCLADAQFEKAMEGDNSEVPAKLHAAVETLAAAYKAMSDEELQELLDSANGTMTAEIALAAAGGDLAKALEGVASEEDLAKLADAEEGDALTKAEDRISALEDEREELLKTVTETTSSIEALAKAFEDFKNEPAPPKAIAMPAGLTSLSKTDDTTTQSAAAPAAAGDISKAAPTTDDIAKYLDGLSPEAKAEYVLRASLHPSQGRVITR